MTYSEKKIWLAVSISVLLLTTLPYIYGYLTAPPDRQFMHILLNVPDYGQYLSWFREFATANLIENKMTPEPNDPIFFNLLWWVMGRLSSITGLDFSVLHQLLRYVSGLAFLGAVYAFFMIALPEPSERKLAFFLAVIGAGFGWVLILMKYTITSGELLFPLDVYIAEPNSFLCIMAFPHFILANALIIIVFILAIMAYRKRQIRYAVAAGLVGLILALQHAYDLLILYGILGAFTLLITLRDRKISWFLVKSNFAIGLISFWPGLYSVWLTSANPIWEKVLDQYGNAGVYTPDPFHLLILMGLPLLLTVLTFDGLFPLDKNSDEILFVKGWFIVGFILLYVPTDFQIHMLNSWQIPVAILAARGIYNSIVPLIYKFITERKMVWNSQWVARLAMICIILVASLTNIYLFAWRFVELSRHEYPYYLHQDEVAALVWLNENTEPHEIVLSSYTIGHYIPAISRNKAFLAHWAQTVDFFDKRDSVSLFFDKSAPEIERNAILDKFNVNYIFYGPSERMLGDYDPASASFLELSFSTHLVQLYRVNHDRLI